MGFIPSTEQNRGKQLADRGTLRGDYTHTKTGNPLQKTTTKEDLLSEVTHHILLNQITALNCYIELLIEESREADSTGKYLKKNRGILPALQHQIIQIRDCHGIMVKT